MLSEAKHPAAITLSASRRQLLRFAQDIETTGGRV
jgi:hypothetical protein